MILPGLEPIYVVFFFFQAEDGIRDRTVTGVQTCALPIFGPAAPGLHCRGPFGRLQRARRGIEPLQRWGVRSEERRVGKECRSRGAAGHLKKNSKERTGVTCGVVLRQEMRGSLM